MIEDKTRAKMSDDTASKLAGEIISEIKEYQAEESLVDMKWAS